MDSSNSDTWHSNNGYSKCYNKAKRIGKRNKDNRNKIAEAHDAETVKSIVQMKQTIEELQKEIGKKDMVIADMSKRYYAIAVSFRLLLKQLGSKLENDKNSTELLELLDKILGENTTK